jgi:hypothetical protein
MNVHIVIIIQIILNNSYNSSSVAFKCAMP